MNSGCQELIDAIKHKNNNLEEEEDEYFKINISQARNLAETLDTYKYLNFIKTKGNESEAFQKYIQDEGLLKQISGFIITEAQLRRAFVKLHKK